MEQESPRRFHLVNSWKVILATMVIFGTGVVTGGLLVRHAGPGREHRQPRPNIAVHNPQPAPPPPPPPPRPGAAVFLGGGGVGRPAPPPRPGGKKKKKKRGGGGGGE